MTFPLSEQSLRMRRVT